MFGMYTGKGLGQQLWHKEVEGIDSLWTLTILTLQLKNREVTLLPRGSA